MRSEILRAIKWTGGREIGRGRGGHGRDHSLGNDDSQGRGAENRTA